MLAQPSPSFLSDHIGAHMDSHQGYWDRLADKYDGLFKDDYSAFEDSIVFQLLKSLGDCDGASVLEIGCGTGLGYSMVRRWGKADYLGTDASASMIQLAKKSFPEGEFQRLDMSQVSSLGRRFDYIISMNAVCSYISDVDALLLEVSKISKPGARILLSFLNRWWLRRFLKMNTATSEPLQSRGGPKSKNGELQFLYSKSELIERIERAGFSTLDAKAYGLLGGLWQSSFSAKLETRFPNVGRSLGHTLIVTAKS